MLKMEFQAECRIWPFEVNLVDAATRGVSRFRITPFVLRREGEEWGYY